MIFLAVTLRTPKVYSDLEAMSSGGTAKGVSQKSLAELSFVIPKSIKEQAKIGTFSTLDHTITFHQREPLCRFVFSLSVRVSALSSRHLDFQALELYADMFSVLWSYLRVLIVWLR